MNGFYCAMHNTRRTCCIIIVLRMLHVLSHPYKVLYTETSLTSFMTFWILAQILWKNSTDFYVPFYYFSL